MSIETLTLKKALANAAEILANFKPEGERDKLDEWQACYAMLFTQMADLVQNRQSHTAAQNEKLRKWQPIETAPRDESLFLLRCKRKHTVVEASFFWDQEFMDGHPITEKYLCLQDMTNDEPIEPDWDGYEWMPCPTTDVEDESTNKGALPCPKK